MEENLKEKLFNKKEVGWKDISTREKEAIYSFSKNYIDFLNKSKIEREAVCTPKKLAEENGFKDLSTFETLSKYL